MANKSAIMSKLGRNAEMLGLSVSYGLNSIVVANGANSLTVSYVDAVIQSPMGGVSADSAPFLGMGVAAPGQLKIMSAINTAGTIADVIDGKIALEVFALAMNFGNDVILSNSDASYVDRIRGNVDLLGMGQ